MVEPISVKPMSVKIAEAKQAIEAGVISPASQLSVETADKLQNVSGFWGLIRTPAGIAGLTALIVAVGSNVIAPIFGKAIPTDQVLQVQIVKMPDDMKISWEIPGVKPMPLPKPAKAVRIAAFSGDAVPGDKGIWDKFTQDGYMVDYYSPSSPKATEWASLIQAAGGTPCFLVVSATDYYGGGPITTKDKTIAAISDVLSKAK